MRAPLGLAILLAVTPTGAVSLKVAAPGRGATLTGWSGAVAPALATLKGWDFTGETDRSKLLPLTIALEGLEGRASTPEGFSALKPAEKEAVLGQAIAAAARTAQAKAAELMVQIRSGTQVRGAAFALRGAEAFLVSHGPYLTGTARRDLEEAMPVLRAAAAREREGRVGTRLEGIRQGLVETRAEEEPFFQAEILPAGAPLPAAYDERFSLSRARGDQGPLARVREKHGFAIRSAAARGDRAAFWARADDAFDDLEVEFLKDDLELIEEHPIGPWADARLAAYERQADSLWALVQQAKEKNGLGGRPAQTVTYGREIPTIETQHEDDEAYALVRKKLSAVRERAAKRLIARRAPALKAADKLGGSKSIDARAAQPLVALTRYHERNLAAAEASPDPRALVQARGYGRDPMIPSPAKLLQLWEIADSKSTRTTLRDREWALAGAGALFATTASALAYFGILGGALTSLAVALLYAGAALRMRALRRGFEGLEARLRDLLGR